MTAMLGRTRRDAATERVLFALVANRALDPSSKLAAAHWAGRKAHIDRLPATTDDACYRAMDWLHQVRHALEKQVFSQVATALDLEVDLLFFDTTSTYFELDEEDEPVPRDKDGSPARGRPPAGTAARPPQPGRGHGRRGRPGDGRVPRVRQVQGPPRRPAPDRDRHGRHPHRDPGPGLVLAREHRRLRADPPGQGRHAGLDAGRRSSGSPTAGSPRRPTAATCAAATTTTSSGRSSAPAPPRPPPRCPGRAATRRSPGTCGSRKSGSPTTSGS